MRINDNQLVLMGNHSVMRISSWRSMFLSRIHRLKNGRITLLLGSLCLAVFTLPFHSVFADLRSLSEPVRQDVEVLKSHPHSIAFHSSRDGNNEIYLMNPDGSDQTRLTFDSRSDQRPDISPDGRRIVFSSNRITETNPTGDFEIFVMNADGSDLRRVTPDTGTLSWQQRPS